MVGGKEQCGWEITWELETITIEKFERTRWMMETTRWTRRLIASGEMPMPSILYRSLPKSLSHSTFPRTNHQTTRHHQAGIFNLLSFREPDRSQRVFQTILSPSGCASSLRIWNDPEQQLPGNIDPLERSNSPECHWIGSGLCNRSLRPAERGILGGKFPALTSFSLLCCVAIILWALRTDGGTLQGFYHGVSYNLVLNEKILQQLGVALAQVLMILLLFHANLAVGKYGETKYWSWSGHDAEFLVMRRSGTFEKVSWLYDRTCRTSCFADIYLPWDFGQ